MLAPHPWPTDGTVIHLVNHPRSRHARHLLGNILGNALHDLGNALHGLDNALLDNALHALNAPDNALAALRAVLHFGTLLLTAHGNLAHNDRIERSRVFAPSHLRLTA